MRILNLNTQKSGPHLKTESKDRATIVNKGLKFKLKKAIGVRKKL